MTDRTDPLSQLLESSAITLVAIVLGAGMAFLIRVLAARQLGTDAYGLFVLGLVIVDVAVLLPLAGFHESLPRELPRSESPTRLFLSVAAISIPLSICVALLLVVGADAIAEVFSEPDIAPLVTVFALAIPFVTVRRLAVGAFRGFGDALGGVLTQNVFWQTAVLVVIAAAFILNLDVLTLTQGWVAAIALTTVLSVGLLAYRVAPVSLRRARATELDVDLLALVGFSVPLMFSGLLWDMMRNVDNIVLGAFLDSAAVGTYDAAYTLGQVLFVFTTALGFLFLPILSSYHEAGDTEGMHQLYRLANKWLVICATPVFVLLIGVPEVLLTDLFGSEFASGLALSLLAVGFFTHALGGLNSNALIAVGESRRVLVGVLLAFGVNVALNLVLIPRYGILGAGAASTASFVVLNGYNSLQLALRHGIHQFTRPWFEALVTGLLYFGGTVALARVLGGTDLRRILLVVALLSVGYLVAVGTVVKFEQIERDLVNSVLTRVRSHFASGASATAGFDWVASSDSTPADDDHDEVHDYESDGAGEISTTSDTDR